MSQAPGVLSFPLSRSPLPPNISQRSGPPSGQAGDFSQGPTLASMILSSSVQTIPRGGPNSSSTCCATVLVAHGACLECGGITIRRFSATFWSRFFGGMWVVFKILLPRSSCTNFRSTLSHQWRTVGSSTWGHTSACNRLVHKLQEHVVTPLADIGQLHALEVHL